MSYGKFTDGGKAFVISTPFTPTTWANKLFNDNFHINISQRLMGGGEMLTNDFSSERFFEDQNAFYLNVDGKSYILCKGMGKNYSCEHRLYQTEITEEFDGVEVKVRVFVPVNGARVFWTATVKNTSGEEKQISLFSLFTIHNPGYMAYETKYDQNGYIYHTGFPYYVRYEDKEKVEPNKRIRYVLSDVLPDSFECNKQRFFGCDDYSVVPLAVSNNKCESKMAELEENISAMQHKKCLASGEEFSVNFLWGIEKEKETIDDIAKNFPNVEKELDDIKALWDKRCEAYFIDTPDTELNYLTNYWFKRQTYFFGRLNRGGSYCPIRNQLQDYIGYSILEPRDAYERALKVVARQHHNGYIKQWYLTNGEPDRALCLINHSDAPIWLVLCLVEIVEQNGDKSLYETKIPYMDSPVSESLLTHLKKAAYYMATRRGEHGLCLILDGDWNDPVNGPGHLGKGESTWNTVALAYAIERLNSISFDEGLEKIRQELINSVNEHCWDGDWYVAGIDDFGKPYGSKKDADAQKFLNAQTWAIISGAAKGDRLEKVKATIESMKNDFGYTLIDPPFQQYSPVWGRVSIKQRGTTENGSVYCHSVMFKAFADCLLRDGDMARDTILSVLPTNPKNPPEKNLQIPTHYSNYYVGAEGDNYGRSSCHYNTGTTAWHIWLILEHICGLKNTTDGVKLNPVLPSAWANMTLTRKLGEDKYTLSVKDGNAQLNKN